MANLEAKKILSTHALACSPCRIQSNTGKMIAVVVAKIIDIDGDLPFFE